MGGCAHIIEGFVREDALVSKVASRGFLSRLLGGSKHDEVQRASMGDSTLINVPCRGLSSKLHDDFSQYLKQQFPKPDEATSSVLDYLGIARTSVYIRGEEKLDSCVWYTQVTFTGCAGMADVSAEVCSHWAVTWAQDRLESFLRPVLDEFGFEVGEQTAEYQDVYKFIRVDVGSQSLYGIMDSDGNVDLDGAIYEELTEDFDQFNERLKNRYALKDSSADCECQLCEQNR